MMSKPTQAEKMLGLRIFQEGQTMTPYKAEGVWQKFNSLENADYHTRPWLEITTDCPGCIGVVEDGNAENTFEGIDGGVGTALDAR